MKSSAHQHQKIRRQKRIFTIAALCLIAILAWFSNRHSIAVDVSATASNSLSEASIKLLQQMPETVTIDAYLKTNTTVRPQIKQLIERYQRYKPEITLNFFGPEHRPERMREVNIGSSGAIIVSYQGKTEKLRFLDEQSLSNTLLHLANSSDHRIMFLIGHGERETAGKKPFGYGQLSNELTQHRITVQSFNPATSARFPLDAELIVLSAPTVPYLTNELEWLKRYIKQGGNLLILAEPNNRNLDGLLRYLGLHRLPGTIVNSHGGPYDTKEPSFTLIGDYPTNPITRDLKTMTLYPAAAALEAGSETNFQIIPLLESAPDSWSETGSLTDKPAYDNSNEKQGPLKLGYALFRKTPDNKRETLQEQRIVVIGDGDFLSNAYIAKIGNLEFGLRIFNWLLQDDSFIDIPAKFARDKRLTFTSADLLVIGLLFIVALPLLFLSTGLYIWDQRKRR